MCTDDVTSLVPQIVTNHRVEGGGGGGGGKAYTSNMQLLLVWQQFVFNTDSFSVPYYISTQPNLFLRETSSITLRDCWVIIFGFMNKNLLEKRGSQYVY